jgi:hypothetical protein
LRFAPPAAALRLPTGHTAGALCGAGTGNHELKSTSYEGLTGRYIFQLLRSKPEIDHKLLELVFPSYF